jgi:predicted deacylase
MQMGQLVTDMRFGADPKKWFKEFLISRHFDPKQFEFDDQEWEGILQKMAEPPPDPSLEVAKINAESRNQIAELTSQVKAMLEHGRQQTDQIKMQHISQENEADRQKDILVQQIESGMQQAVEGMRESGMNKRTVETLKQKIADTALKLRTQKDLAGTEVIKPAVEPKGRAKPGKSFSQ